MITTIQIIQQLSSNAQVYQSLLGDLSPDVFNWKSAPDKWCILEVLCHLLDEEREDFRARTRHTLETPGNPLPPIDPTGWVISRSYLQQDYQETLDQFLKERTISVNWLLSLHNPDWSRAYLHPKFGPMSASMFLHNWLAHDYHHLRQIIRLKYEYLHHSSTEDLSYAGNW